MQLHAFRHAAFTPLAGTVCIVCLVPDDNDIIKKEKRDGNGGIRLFLRSFSPTCPQVSPPTGIQGKDFKRIGGHEREQA